MVLLKMVILVWKKHKNFAKKFVIRYNEFVSILYGFCMYNVCILYIQLKR